MRIQDQKKFNGKIYGSKGSYSIYVAGNKVDVTDKQVAEYQNFLDEVYFVKAAESHPLLRCDEVTDISIELGFEHPFETISIENAKKKIAQFPITVIFEKEVTMGGKTAVVKIEKVERDGKFLKAYVSTSLGFTNLLDEDELQEVLKQVGA